MKINLKTAVSRLFPTHSFDMIYIEAMANALDAKATEIRISIDYRDGTFNKFKIKDNGIGFNDLNYQRFSNLMDGQDSSHKGQGRLVYLHYFNNVKFNSTYFNHKDKLEDITFDFNFDFIESNTNKKPSNSKSTGTEISFLGFDKGRIRKKEDLYADNIRELILAEFLPSFQKIKEKKQKINIHISSNIDGNFKSTKISIDDIPNFSFITIDDNELKSLSPKLYRNIKEDLFREPLTLYYYLNLESQSSSIITSFAIDNRAIKVPIIDSSNYIPGVEAIFFISSRNFDGQVDPTRKELTISQNDLQEIKKIFKQKIDEILSKSAPQFKDNKNKEEIFLTENYPHLFGYIPKHEIGFSSRKDILYKARDKFFDDQRYILEKDHLTSEDYQKALDLSSRNLAEYIIFRQKQIEKLNKITKNDREKVIHDLISPQKDINNQNNINIFKNNAWILDDRFMSFYYSFSDTPLNEISKLEIFGRKSESIERPDFLLLFSKPLTEEYLKSEIDIVIFEFKRLNVNKHEKLKAASELRSYANEIKKIVSSEIKVGRIWLYALVDIDDNFRETLEQDDFKSRFSPQGEIWYKYYEKLSLEISFLDFNALLYDASTRNETFIKILKDSLT